jgi:hypothetical protein
MSNGFKSHTEQQHLVTGQSMPVPSPVYPIPRSEQEIRPSTASKKDLIARYYLTPLTDMDGDQAFIAMSICFLLYEKYLRRTGKLKRGEKFSEGSKVFNQIGSDMGGSAVILYWFSVNWKKLGWQLMSGCCCFGCV